MSNTYKVIIAIVAISILTATAIFIDGQSRQPNTPLSTSSNSGQMVSRQVSQIKSVESYSQVVVSSLISSSVSTNDSKVVTTQSTETIDGVQVTYLDSKNPPQYIKDYFGCETRDKYPLSGYFIKIVNLINYECAPTNESEYLCPDGVYSSSKISKNWNCIPKGVGTPMECNIIIENVINKSTTIPTLKLNYTKAKSVQSTDIETCIIFTNNKLSKPELDSVISYGAIFKIINYYN